MDAKQDDAPVMPGDGLEDADPCDLTKLHINYKKALRVQTTVIALPFLIAALVVEEANIFPKGMVVIPIAMIALAAIIRLPARRHFARGYEMSADRLRVVRGILFHSDTIVPFGRVQHIDVDQGPLERFYGIATLTLHTAGTQNSSVNLPGLEQALAMEMREEIRSHIKRESI